MMNIIGLDSINGVIIEISPHILSTTLLVCFYRRKTNENSNVWNVLHVNGNVEMRRADFVIGHFAIQEKELSKTARKNGHFVVLCRLRIVVKTHMSNGNNSHSLRHGLQISHQNLIYDNEPRP